MSNPRYFRKICGVVLVLVAIPHLLLAASGAHGKTHRDSRVLYSPLPKVPMVARAENFHGDGYFQFVLRPDGTVLRVDVLRSTGHPILDDATIAALSKWRFAPGTPTYIRVPVGY
jgi:TonB family protein